MMIINIYRAHDIVPLCLPPHTTHYLQPLDVGIFGPLEKAYKKQLEQQNMVGEVQVDKISFLEFLKTARQETMQQANIMSAWSATGKLSSKNILR